MILPHTDLGGAYAIAERIRGLIGGVRSPRLDREGVLRVAASLSVAASSNGDKDALINHADVALYTAKRKGKNRTILGQPQTANVSTAE